MVMTSSPPIAGAVLASRGPTVLSVLYIFRRMACHSAKRLVQADDRS